MELFLREVTEARFHTIEHVPRAAHALARRPNSRDSVIRAPVAMPTPGIAAIADGDTDPKLRNDPTTLASTPSAIPTEVLRPPLPTKRTTSSRPVSASGPSALNRSRGRSPGGEVT